MDENSTDMYAVLESFKNAIQMIESRLDSIEMSKSETDKELYNLQSILFDDIINPAKAAMDNADKEERFTEFSDKHGERLGAYDDTLKVLENDDNFSLARTAFDDYDALEEPKPNEDEYIDSLVDKVEAQLTAVKESLGVAPDSEVTATVDGDGEVEIQVDGETVVDENSDAPVENEESLEENSEGEATEEETEEAAPEFNENGEEVSDPEALKALYEELAQARK